MDYASQKLPNGIHGIYCRGELIAMVECSEISAKIVQRLNEENNRLSKKIDPQKIAIAKK